MFRGEYRIPRIRNRRLGIRQSCTTCLKRPSIAHWLPSRMGKMRRIQDIGNLRESECHRLNAFASVQPWLRPEATVFISGELSRVGDFLNETKSAIEERRHKPELPGSDQIAPGRVARPSYSPSKTHRVPRSSEA